MSRPRKLFSTFFLSDSDLADLKDLRLFFRLYNTRRPKNWTQNPDWLWFDEYALLNQDNVFFLYCFTKRLGEWEALVNDPGSYCFVREKGVPYAWGKVINETEDYIEIEY